MSEPMELRPALSGDLDAVADVWYESASHMDGAEAQLPSRNELRDRIDTELASGWHLYVATQGHRVVGMLAIKPHIAMLDQLFILPGDQGTGIGTALLDLAKRMMPAGFSLRMAASNEQARRFYEKEGLKLLRHGIHPRTNVPVCYYGWKVR